jgi:all-trans-retinol 13,14-reductase
MATPPRSDTFDAIVIGSGIGGLTVANLLARRHNQRVLVLEQHFKPGGFTHIFKRKVKFQWDVGLHYVGNMDDGDTGKAVFDYLTDGQLRWHKMPDPFEKFVYPDFTFEVYSDPARFEAELIRQFPQEATAIRQYFKDIQRAGFWFGAHAMAELLPAGLQALGRFLLRQFGAMARQTTQHYLDQHFQDARLKALLASQWGDYGLPPSQSCFGVHGLIVDHYLHGGWYPEGGAVKIARTMMPAIKAAGGDVVTQRRVTEILIKDGIAVGVKAQNTTRPLDEPEIYRAPIVVSDAGAFNTYVKLIPASYPLPERQQIQAFPKGSSMVTLYIGLKESPQTLGFQGENHWIYNTYDHEAVGHDRLQDGEYRPKFAYLSFPSLKDPLAEGHTAEIISHINYDAFVPWREQPWGKRDADYNALKDRMTEALLDLVEGYYPGFRALIDYTELSTPLTVEYFDASDRGAIYGIPCVPERLDQTWAGARTPIKNLYLTGSDAMSFGIVGAMMGGVKTAGILDGPFGFFKLMATISAAAQRQSK